MLASLYSVRDINDKQIRAVSGNTMIEKGWWDLYITSTGNTVKYENGQNEAIKEIIWAQRAHLDQWLHLKLVEMPNYSSRAKDQEDKEKWGEPLLCSAQAEQQQCKQRQRRHSHRVSSLCQGRRRAQEQATEARRQDKALLSRSPGPRFLTVTVWGAEMQLWNGGWCQVRRPGEGPDLQKSETVFQAESIAKALRSWLTHHFIGREKRLWPVHREQGKPVGKCLMTNWNSNGTIIQKWSLLAVEDLISDMPLHHWEPDVSVNCT